MLALEPADREAYWQGDDAVLTRLGVPVDAPTGRIHTLIIDVHESCRETWQEQDLDDEELETLERRQEADERRRAAEERERACREQLAAEAPRLPPAPANAYTPVRDDDDPRGLARWAD